MSTWRPSGWAETNIRKQQQRKEARYWAILQIVVSIGLVVDLVICLYIING